jgi:gas vesicle protein
MSEERTGMKVFISFLAGAAVGAGLGLLFAPQSGKETRRKIKELSDKVGDEVKDGYDKISEKAKTLVDGARTKFRKGDE